MLGQTELSEAAKILERPVPNGPELDQLELRRQIDRADLLSKSGSKPEARRLLEGVRSSVRDPELATRIDILEGAVLANLAELDRAETLLQRAVAESTHRNDLYQEASALLNLSFCRIRRYRYGEASDFGVRSLEVAEKIDAKRVAAIANSHLGTVYTFLGDLDRASTHQQKAVEILQNLPDRLNLVIALGELGLCFETQGQIDKAIAAYKRAFDLSVDIKSNPDAAKNANNLANAYMELRRWDEAARWNHVAATRSDSMSTPYTTLNAARILCATGHIDDGVRAYQALTRMRAMPPGLVWDAHILLAQEYVEKGNHPAARAEFEKALELVEKSRVALHKDTFKFTFLARLISFYQDYVDLLVSQNDDARALTVIESSRARVLAERLGQSDSIAGGNSLKRWKELARSTNTCFLSFWIAPKRSFAWLIGSEGVQRFELPPLAEIRSLIAQYSTAVEHSVVDPRTGGDEAGSKLWNILLSNIAPKIPRGARVIEIPDGPLHRLSLESLPVPGSVPRYWVQDVVLAVAPSLTTAAAQPESHPVSASSILMIGDPNYAGTGYSPLPNAEPELHAIESGLRGWEQTVAPGTKASSAAYRTSDPERFSIIHFAAHAEARNDEPLESAIILSPGPGGIRLCARDVMAIPIRASLVTISGCRSAGTRTYAGEGLIGLAWGFLRAGARNVIAGLWDVNDESTSLLMSDLYRRIAQGSDPATALHDAKLEMLSGKRFSRPFYWAPFQVYTLSLAR